MRNSEAKNDAEEMTIEETTAVRYGLFARLLRSTRERERETVAIR
jgi:hypothetical protein